MRPPAALLFLAFLAASVPSVAGHESVSGPGLLCFNWSTFQLLDNERVTSFTSSAEAMRLDVVGPAGRYHISESDIFAEPRQSRRLVFRSGQTSIFQVRARDYAIYGPAALSKGTPRLVLWLSGPALHRGKSDAHIFERLKVRDTAGVSCSHKFTYSWDQVLGPDNR